MLYDPEENHIDIPAVKQFMDEYLDLEYAAHMSTLDDSITAKEHLDRYDNRVAAYWGANSPARILHNLETFRKDAKMEINEALLVEWRKAFYRRTVFQIQAYVDPTLGEKLAQKFHGVKEIYRCILSPVQCAEEKKLNYSVAYSIIRHQEKWLMIYNQKFRKGFWDEPGGPPTGHVLSFGIRVKVVNYANPSDEVSLNVFKKEQALR